jgi:hypothetical protein
MEAAQDKLLQQSRLEQEMPHRMPRARRRQQLRPLHLREQRGVAGILPRAVIDDEFPRLA